MIYKPNLKLNKNCGTEIFETISELPDMELIANDSVCAEFKANNRRKFIIHMDGIILECKTISLMKNDEYGFDYILLDDKHSLDLRWLSTRRLSIEVDSY